MRIGIDARMFGPSVGGGGLGRYVEQLINELQTIDRENRYVLFLKKENFGQCHLTNPLFEKRLADVHWYGWKEQLTLPNIIDREQLDLVHFPHWNVPIILRTPYVVTIHDLILLEEPRSATATTRSPFVFAAKQIGYHFTLSRALKRARKIITVSHATQNSILKFFPKISKAKISVISEGVTPLHDDNVTSYESLAPYLLTIGNAYPHKNLTHLLNAFALIHTTHPNLRLVIAGRADIFSERLGNFIARDYAKLSITQIMNPTDEQIASLYKNATLYIFPSRIEGFGLPGLEAMSAGIPVVASDIPSLKEIYADAALYASTTDCQHLASVIMLALNDDKVRQSLISAGHKRILNFSWRKMAQKMKNLYETSS